MRYALMLAVMGLVACGGSEGDDPGKDPTDETKQCVLPEGLECHAWWPDWPSKEREGTFCLPVESDWNYQCWWIERSPRCDPGERTAVYLWPNTYEYEEVCVASGEKPSCTVAGEQSAHPQYDAITHTPVECLRPWESN